MGIVMIAFVGICCSVVGTVLGAMKAQGREHLTVSLLMIGVGIVLVTVSGIAWRLTSQDAPTCRAMLGLGGEERLMGGHNLARGHPYAGMIYSEFQYRPPPPSYQASMQEYHDMEQYISNIQEHFHKIEAGEKSKRERR